MTELCTICEQPLEDGRPIQRDLDGTAAHFDCLEVVLHPDEGDDDE